MTHVEQNESQAARFVAPPCSGSCLGIRTEHEYQRLAQVQVDRGMEAVAAHRAVDASKPWHPEHHTFASDIHQTEVMSCLISMYAVIVMPWSAPEVQAQPCELDHHCCWLARRPLQLVTTARRSIMMETDANHRDGRKYYVASLASGLVLSGQSSNTHSRGRCGQQ